MQERGQREVTEASMWGKSGKRVGESGVGQTAGRPGRPGKPGRLGGREAGEAGEAGHSWQVWDKLGQGTVLGRPGPAWRPCVPGRTPCPVPSRKAPPGSGRPKES